MLSLADCRERISSSSCRILEESFACRKEVRVSISEQRVSISEHVRQVYEDFTLFFLIIIIIYIDMHAPMFFLMHF